MLQLQHDIPKLNILFDKQLKYCRLSKYNFKQSKRALCNDAPFLWYYTNYSYIYTLILLVLVNLIITQMNIKYLESSVMILLLKCMVTCDLHEKFSYAILYIKLYKMYSDITLKLSDITLNCPHQVDLIKIENKSKTDIQIQMLQKKVS